MSIKRFFAKTASEALRKVRDAFGPEGVILSNRSMDGGIEILALRQDDITALIPAAAPEEAAVKEPGAGHTLTAHRVVEGNEAKPAHNAQTSLLSFLSSKKNGLECAEKADMGSKGLSRPDVSSPSDEEKAQRAGRGIDTSDANFVAFHDVKKESGEFILRTAQGSDSANSAKKRRSTRKLGQPAHPEAADKSAGKEVSDASVVVSPDKRRRNARKAAGEAIKDAAISSKRKPGRASAIDSRQLANEVAASVLCEIKSMRGTLEQQLASLNWDQQGQYKSTRGRLLRHLMAAGFSSSVAHDLLDQLPDRLNTGNDEEEAIKHIKTALTCNLKAKGNEYELLDKGGVYALVGPTGIGKTTTTAKLAARCVIRHGADKLALLTTDDYRIGGHEQLRIYGRILGVSVHAVKDAKDLTLALAELQDKHLVLIDTVGVGQRNQMVARQLEMLGGCGTEIKRLLLLNAASNGHTLNEVVQAYRGNGLAGAIITKLDEAVTMGGALDTAIRHCLPLYYVTQGQRVPEDLEVAVPAYLVNRALDNLPASPYIEQKDVFPLFNVGHESSNTSLNTSGVRFD